MTLFSLYLLFILLKCTKDFLRTSHDTISIWSNLSVPFLRVLENLSLLLSFFFFCREGEVYCVKQTLFSLQKQKIHSQFTSGVEGSADI